MTSTEDELEAAIQALEKFYKRFVARGMADNSFAVDARHKIQILKSKKRLAELEAEE